MSRPTCVALSVIVAVLGTAGAAVIVSAERLSAADVPVDDAFGAMGMQSVVIGGAAVVLTFAAAAFAAAVWLIAREDLSPLARRWTIVAAALAAVLLALVLNPDPYATDRTLIAATVFGLLSVRLVVSSGVALATAGRQPALFRTAGWDRFFDGAGYTSSVRRRAVSAGRIVSVLLLVLTVVIEASLEELLGRNWAVAILVPAAWLCFRIGKRSPSPELRAARRTMRRRLIGVTVFAACLLTLLREHHWLGLVVAAVVVLAALTCLLVRMSAPARVIPIVLVFSGVVWGGVAGWSDAHEFPSAQSLVAQRGGVLVCGIYVTSRDGQRWYWDKTLGRLVADAEAATTLGPSGPLEGWLGATQKLAQRMLASSGLPPVLDRSQLCRGPTPTPSEDAALAEQFAPRIVLDQRDGFWPVSALTLFDLRRGSKRTCVEGGSGGCPDALRTPAALPWLGGQGEWIELPGRDDDREAQHRAMVAVLGRGTPAESARLYYLVTDRPDKPDPIGIQYWFYYVFNYQPLPAGQSGLHFPSGFHEGDFEHIEMVISADGATPRYVWFARHDTEGRAFTWEELATKWLTVFAARGSHASYESCGRKPRWTAGGRAPDLPVCEGAGSLVIERALLTDLARTGWACWRGGFGHRAPGQDTVLRGYLGKGPQSPLWQQPGGRTPCLAFDRDPRPPSRPGADPGETVLGLADGRILRNAAGRPDVRIDECREWEQPPTEGAYLLACDATALARYFASGLTQAPDETATLQLAVGGQETAATIPAVHRDEDVGTFSAWTVTPTTPLRPLVYAACLDVRKRSVAATFSAPSYRAPLPAGKPVRVDDTHGEVWRLVDASGTVYAETAPRRPSGERVDATCGGAR